MTRPYYPKPNDIRFGVHRICKKCGQPYTAENSYSQVCWKCLWGETKVKGRSTMAPTKQENTGMDARQQRLANFRSQFQGQRVWADKKRLNTMGVEFHILSVKTNQRGKYGLTYECEILLDTESGVSYQEKTDSVDDPVQWISFTAETEDGEKIESRVSFFTELASLIDDIGPVMAAVVSFPTVSGNTAYALNITE